MELHSERFGAVGNVYMTRTISILQLLQILQPMWRRCLNVDYRVLGRAMLRHGPISFPFPGLTELGRQYERELFSREEPIMVKFKEL